MRKSQIIAPLVALSLAAGTLLFYVVVQRYKYYFDAQSRQIGRELIESTNSERLVQIDAGLRAELSLLLSRPTRIADIRLGDEPPDRGADTRLFLLNERGSGLVIRLRKESRSDRFVALGYWPFIDPGGRE